MPLAVVGFVELRRPSASGTEFLAVADAVGGTGMVALIPRLRRWARLRRESYALSARTRSGRLRGLPGPRRGTRMASSTGSNCGESPRWPAMITTLTGFRPCSTARWILVVRPPRERPGPWSAGSTAMPPGGSFCRSPFRCPGGVLVGPADGGVDIHVPGDQALRVRLSLELSDDPGPRAIALPAPEQVVDPFPGPVAFRHTAREHRYGSATGCRLSAAVASTPADDPA